MSADPSLFRYVVRNESTRFVPMVALLLLAGVLEGLGVATLLPLLGEIGADAPQTHRLSALIADVMGAMGLVPSLGTLLLTLVTLFTLKAAALYAASLEVGRLVAYVERDLRLRLVRAFVRAEWRHVLRYPTGYIAAALGGEISQTGVAIRMFGHVIAESVILAAYVLVAFLVSWQAALAAVCAGWLIVLLLRGRVKASRSASKDRVGILRSILAHVTDAVPSLKPLKAMDREAYLLRKLEEGSHAYFDAQYRGVAAVELASRAAEPLLVAALALVLWMATRFAPLDTATLLVIAFLFYRTVRSIATLQQRWLSVAMGESSFHSLMEHLDAAEQAKERWTSGGTSDATRLREELRVEGLAFAYDGRRVLGEVNAVLGAGRFVVIVGPSGVGKTTLVDAITGVLRPTNGRILVDGLAMTDIDMRGWRRSIGYVPQEPMLFSDTVRANLTLGAVDVSAHGIEHALSLAGAWEFVSGLPDGVDEVIGERGRALSGGQSRRIAIARALVTNPSLLVLDEPTSGLDRDATSDVCATIAGLKGHLTILAVTHEPSLLAIADDVWQLGREGFCVARGGIRA